jgi:hypothetical protein
MTCYRCIQLNPKGSGAVFYIDEKGFIWMVVNNEQVKGVHISELW